MKRKTVNLGGFGLHIYLSLRQVKKLLLELFEVEKVRAEGGGRGGVEKSAVILGTMNSKI
jgi:hypothetical protein